MVFASKKIPKYFFLFFFLLSCNNTTDAPLRKSTRPEIKFSVGTNLAGIEDWGSGFAFTDAFKHARTWVSLAPNKWGDGRKIFTDKNGWVKLLQFEQRVATLMFTDIKNSYPSGIYTLRFEGKGKFKLSGAGFAGIIEERVGEKKVLLNSSGGGVIIEITETDPEDYLRNIKFIFPGGSCQNNPAEYCDQQKKCANQATCLNFTDQELNFHPLFLENISIYSHLRFMEWMKTNNSPVSSWEDRAKLNDYTWSTDRGVPIETMIKLANLTSKDPWFCMPHLADDEYLNKFAELVKATLDPKLNVFLEYSNEVWNTMFEQAKYAEKMEKDFNFSRYEYYGFKSQNIFEIWNRVFNQRLIKVFSGQSAYSEVTKVGMRRAKLADALAIAPYFGVEADAKIEENILQKVSLDQVRESIKTHKAIADELGLALLAYEGGQHLIPGEQIELARNVNRSNQMEKLYSDYLKIWKEESAGLFMHFTAVDYCTKYGCWGAKESYLQTDEQAPKYRALKNFAKNN